MTHHEAISLIRPAVDPATTRWADIGAGTGVFTLALRDILEQGVVYAVDKSPHMLWRLDSSPEVKIMVVEADFTEEFELHEVDGIVMANALHYAPDPQAAIRHCLAHLVSGGTFVFIEYDTDRPSPPYVPYPISAKRLLPLAAEAGLKNLRILTRRPSVYQGEMYVLAGNT